MEHDVFRRDGAEGWQKKDNTLRLLVGADPIKYSRSPIDDNDCLLGERYLSRGGALLLVAPSGMGKSTAVMQSAILWGCGKEAFGIAPKRTLRTLIVQAEDDTADLRDQAGVINHLNLTAAEWQCVEHNCWVETLNDQVGLEAVDIFEGFLKQREFDLLILNPYTAYFNGEIRDDHANRIFLRRDLQRLMNRFRIGIVLVLHTPKTNFRKGTETWNIFDWMYSAAGAAELTQWARAVLAIDPVGDTGIFRFIAAKRGDRIGWEEKIRYFAHDPRPGVLLWNPTTEAAAKEAKKKKASASIEDVIKLVPLLDAIPKSQLEALARDKGLTRDGFRALLERAFTEHVLYPHRIANPPYRPIAGVSRSEQTQDQFL